MQDCTVNFCGRQRLFSSRKGHCSFHDSSRLRMEKREQDKRTAKRRALSDARDELVRAAVAWRGSVSSEERRLYEMELARKVAVYEKLAGGA